MAGGDNRRGVLFKDVKSRDVAVEGIPVRRNRGMNKVVARYVFLRYSNLLYLQDLYTR